MTSIATFELEFLFWALAWTAGTSLVLLYQTWEASSSLGRNASQPPPHRQVLPWTAACLLLGSLCFVILPRQTLGLRFFPWGVAGLSGSTAGLSNRVEFFDKGPISRNGEVVLRILPADPPSEARRQRFEEAFGLLRGLTLEGLEGQRWETLPDTPPAPQFLASDYEWEHRQESPGRLGAELFVAPNPFGLIPLPAGWVGPLPPPGMTLRRGPGGSTRWETPSRRPVPLRILVDPHPSSEGPMRASRLSLLTFPGTGTEAALAWSRRIAPGDAAPGELAQRLAAELRSYTYTLEKPQRSRRQPLAGFPGTHPGGPLRILRLGPGHCFAPPGRPGPGGERLPAGPLDPERVATGSSPRIRPIAGSSTSMGRSGPGSPRTPHPRGPGAGWPRRPSGAPSSAGRMPWVSNGIAM